jgi:two-component system, sensor histidine kinase and response regulator
MPLRILVADDSAANQLLAVRLLQRYGFATDVAADGAEAVAAADATTYDVVLMDVEMPNLDGVEACRQIAEHAGSDRPWIIACTAGSLITTREDARSLGMDDYLPKPLAPAALAEALRRVPLHG